MQTKSNTFYFKRMDALVLAVQQGWITSTQAILSLNVLSLVLSNNEALAYLHASILKVNS